MERLAAGDIHQAVARLRQAATDGELTRICEHYQVPLLVLFGSAVDPQSDPHDVDLAALLPRNGADVLGFLDALSTVTGTSSIDLMNLSLANPTARKIALTQGMPLVELHDEVFARQQIAAVMEWYDTAWLRKASLKQLQRDAA